MTWIYMYRFSQTIIIQCNYNEQIINYDNFLFKQKKKQKNHENVYNVHIFVKLLFYFYLL